MAHAFSFFIVWGLTSSSSLKIRENIRMKRTAEDLVIVYLEMKGPHCRGRTVTMFPPQAWRSGSQWQMPDSKGIGVRRAGMPILTQASGTGTGLGKRKVRMCDPSMTLGRTHWVFALLGAARGKQG